jgi:hypothetical protein
LSNAIIIIIIDVSRLLLVVDQEKEKRQHLLLLFSLPFQSFDVNSGDVVYPFTESNQERFAVDQRESFESDLLN